MERALSSNSSALKGLQGLLLMVAFVVAAPAQAAPGTGGTSTAGATVTAINPAAATRDGNLHLALSAHVENGTVEDPSCRPQDSTLNCWGSLFLRIPDAGGLTLSGLEVHRVGVGDVSCGDEHDDGCEGHDVSVRSTTGVDLPVEAVVNGVAVVRNPGTIDARPGSTVQLKIRLMDNSDALDADQIDVQVNEFVPGPVKPELYRSGVQTIQQVQIHLGH